MKIERKERPNQFHPGMLGDDPSYWHILEHEPKIITGIDTIIVPQGRSAEHIDHAAYLARDVGARLISLCSHEAKAEQVAAVLERMGDFEWIAIDIPPGYTIPGVEFLAHKTIPEIAQKDPDWNLSDKRNLGQLMARLAKSERAFFHDDDLYILAKALGKVGLMLSNMEIAGLRCGLYPDRSAKMHVRRMIADYHMTRRPLDHATASLVSGNSMGFNVRRLRRPFPPGVYNEDWVLQQPSVVKKQAALAEDYYYQSAYNPLDPERARQEEFGEVLIAGMFHDIEDAWENPAQPHLQDRFFWEKILEAEREFAQNLLDGIEAVPNKRYRAYTPDPRTQQPMPYQQQQELRGSLLAGLDVNVDLDGQNFVDYHEVWREDNIRWADMLNRLPDYPMPIADVCALLGLKKYFTNIHPQDP